MKIVSFFSPAFSAPASFYEAHFLPFFFFSFFLSFHQTSPVVAAITSRLAPGTDQIPLTSSEHVQVVETMQDVAGARKAQRAAFVRQEKCLVIWTDHVDRLEASAQALEDKMISFVWRSASKTPATEIDASTADWNYNQAASQMGHGLMGGSIAHGGSVAHNGTVAGHVPSNAGHESEKQEKDLEASPEYEERPTNLQAPLLHGVAVAVVILLISLMLRTLVQESLIDGKWIRLAIFAAAPFIAVVSGRSRELKVEKKSGILIHSSILTPLLPPFSSRSCFSSPTISLEVLL